jgi:Ca-activated chloride channel homolog
MTFVHSDTLVLLIFLIPALAFFWWRERDRSKRLRKLGNPSLLLYSVPVISSMRRNLKLALWGTASLSLTIALARPIWGEELSVVETEGVSVIVVLDVSNSMNAQDISPSRLERAKLAIQDLFDGIEGNEIALILFAGRAFVQFPLTTDVLSAATFVRTVSSDAISRQGTNIGAALQLAMDSFNDALSSQRFIILMSDGENHEGDSLKVADAAAEQGITIFTVGYGTFEGAPIPMYDQNRNEIGYRTDVDGNTILSVLDETILRAIAARTGGIYQQANSADNGFSNLAETINAAHAEQLERRTELHGIERFGIFVAFALLALSIEILLAPVGKKVA